MISTTIELAGFMALTAGTYELAGRGWALVVLGLALLFVGSALSGIDVRLPGRKKNETKKRKPVGEKPLTNADLDAK